MRRVIAVLIAAVFTAAIVFGASVKAYAKEYKIGYADPEMIMEGYKKTKDVTAAFEKKGKEKQVEDTKYVDEIKKLKDEQALLSEKGKAEKQKVIDEKIKNLQDFRRKAQADMMKDRNDLLGSLYKDVLGSIEAYAKEKGYDLILNARAMMYGSPQDDVTKDVLDRLNK